MEDDWKTALAQSAIPRYMHEGLVRWIENHVEPGHFLAAVLSNDLREACVRADENNRRALVEYVIWLHNHAPAECWGSPERYDTWRKHKTI
jgi:hypothetical protein